MAGTPGQVTFRPITGAEELELFCRLPYQLNHELADDLAAGRRRPGWMWVAISNGRLLGRVAWWGRAGDPVPRVLDVFDLVDTGDAGTLADAVDVGVRLLGAAAAHVVPPGTHLPDYSRFLGAEWRSDPDERAAFERRRSALETTGAAMFVERLRLEWRPGGSRPPAGCRLSYRPVQGRVELVALMTRVLDGTLDAHDRDDLATRPAAAVAAEHYDDELGRYTSPRDWWRIGMLADGEPVGFVVPARNSYNPIIAYIGVLPEHRGRGHVDELLDVGTRILAAQGSPRIRAATDVGNVPMARAFARAGYAVIGREIDLRWPPGGRPS